MAIKRISPNRMELLKLRKSLSTSKRGHKLLKDKLDELLKVFLERIEQNKELRAEVEKQLSEAYAYFAIVRAQTSKEIIDSALLSQDHEGILSFKTVNVMSVPVPELGLEREIVPRPYSLTQTPTLLDTAVHDRMQKLIPLMITLASREKAIELLAAEIEQTRRRVNALEHVLIPQQEASVREIVMKLDENDRAERTRLMKVKDMLEKQE